jgi:serine/threonine protein kinase
MADIRLCDPGICGSLPYIAPEVLEKKEQYDPRGLDVWSSAVVMLYLIFGGSIWECAKANDNNPNYKMLVTAWAKWEAKHEAGETMSESDYPRMMPFDKFIDQPVIRRILLGMLHPDPAKRSTIAQVAKNGWLSRHVECCTVESYNEPAGTIDATKLSKCSKVPRKVVMHNHLPPTHHFGHSLVRLPGSTAM